MIMRKSIFIGIILLISLLAPLCAQEKETLAVLDFKTEAVSEIEMSAIVEFLSAELFKTKKYIVIDVSQRETILREMEFSLSGCSDDSCALEIGKMLSAELIVTGNLSKVGSRYLMSVKMLETETSRTKGTANGKFSDLDELIDGLEPIALSLTGIEETVQVAVVIEAPKEVEPVAETVSEAEAEAVNTEVLKLEPKEANQASQTGKQGEGAIVPAVICTAGGVIGLGTGGYFLYHLFAESLPVYKTAMSAYDNAFGDAEFDTLFNNSSSTYESALTDLIIGASVTGVGIILTTVGILLFPPAEDDEASISFLPTLGSNPGMIVRVSY